MREAVKTVFLKSVNSYVCMELLQTCFEVFEVTYDHVNCFL